MLINPFILHGIMMWTTWGLFALIQIISQRHLKGTLWRQSFWVHAITGSLLYLIQFSFALYGSNLHYGYRSKQTSTHSTVVTPTYTASALAVVLGILVHIQAFLDKLEWNTKALIMIRLIHKFVGYLFIIGG